MQNLKIVNWYLIPLLVIFNSIISVEKNTNFKEIKHEVTIQHPGEKEPIISTLVEVQNSDGLPIHYYMDVKSVICLAEVCKVIPVTIFWNAIGEYQHYKLQKEATLEKYEADKFESEDYTKLHSILTNKNSPFKDVYIDEIWTVPSSLNDDVDAISGETILELDEKDTVKGAALTCYTLWHWANGEIIQHIKNTTGNSASNAQLKQFITHENKTFFNIAIKELKQRKLYTMVFATVIVKRVLKNKTDLKTALSYIETTPTEIYLTSLSEVFTNGEKEHRLQAIHSLKQYDSIIPTSYLDKLTATFSTIQSYQEITLLLELMEKKNSNSTTIIKNTMPLLNGNFLIARRAYWFLKTQTLTNEQSSILNKFYKKNKEKL